MKLRCDSCGQETLATSPEAIGEKCWNDLGRNDYCAGHYRQVTDHKAAPLQEPITREWLDGAEQERDRYGCLQLEAANVLISIARAALEWRTWSRGKCPQFGDMIKAILRGEGPKVKP